MSKMQDISNLRGLGDPMFFSFSIVDEKNKIMVGHAVIMGTFILNPEAPLNLCQLDDDPRLRRFVHYILSNKMLAGDKQFAAIQKRVDKLAELKQELAIVKAEFKQLGVTPKTEGLDAI